MFRPCSLWVVGVTTTLAGFFAAGHARAGNLDGQLLTLEAALQSGEITAGARDADAVWYNPAGLAPYGERSTVSLGLSAYGIQFSSLPPIQVDESLNAQPQDLSPLQLTVVPSSVVWTKPLTPKIGLGFGAFTPVANQIWTRNAVDFTDPNSGNTDRLVWENRGEADQLYLGVGIGGWATEKLRLGATLFGIYATGSGHFSLGLGDLDNVQNGGLVVNVNQESTRVSMRLVTGAQWDATRNLTFGLTVQSPVVNAWEENRVSVLAATAEASPGLSAIGLEFGRNAEANVVLAEQVRFLLGAEWKKGRWVVAGGGSWRPPLEDGETQLFNWRAGVRFKVVPSLELGGGFFTDRAPIRASNPDQLPSLSFYGGSFGIRLSTRYGAEMEYDWYDLPNGRKETVDDAPPPEKEPVEFITSIVARYAYGRGTGRTFSFQTQAAGVAADFSGQPVRNHELGLMISSGVRY